jgi:hypothetical protein
MPARPVSSICTVRRRNHLGRHIIAPELHRFGPIADVSGPGDRESETSALYDATHRYKSKIEADVDIYRMVARENT